VGTERLCAATRVVRPTEELIRFVAGPDGEVVADLKCKLPGRGVWITATRGAVERAVRSKAIPRSLKRELRVPSRLADEVEKLLEGFALDALGIAHKAGEVIVGFARVEDTLAREQVAALLRAADASSEGARKIDRLVASTQHRKLPIVTLFRSAQLDLALGRANVVHAALLAGRASDTFLARCRALERFRTDGSKELPVAS
jgi:uncharacterized protein